MIPHFTQGDRLRKARELMGFSASEMAARLDVNRATIARWEHDAHVPRTALLAYSAVCDVPIEWLEEGSERVTAGYLLVA